MNDVGLLTNLSDFPLYLIKNRDAVLCITKENLDNI